MTALDPAPATAGSLDPTTPRKRAITLTHLEEFGEILVAAVGEPGPAGAALLSCRVHEAISAAGPATTVVVDLGGLGPNDRVVVRVLRCARESAATGGVALRVLGES